MTLPLCLKVKKNKEELNSFLMKVKEENEKLKPQHSEN